MQSKVHPHIEAFYKSFYLPYPNVRVDGITYENINFRSEQTLQDAKDLILKDCLSLTVKHDKFFMMLIIDVISDFERMENNFGTFTEQLTELQKQLS